MASAPASLLFGCLRLPDRTLRAVRVTLDGPRILRIDENVGEAAHLETVAVPGLVDVHIHGCGGADWLDATEESLRTISTTAAQGGATSIVSTTTIANDDDGLRRFARQMDLLRAARPLVLCALHEVSPLPGARVLGLYLEGPWLNPARRGGFGPRYVAPIDLDRAAQVLDLCADLLIKITLAPELPNGEALIDLIQERCPHPVAISLGHTEVDYATARRLFARPDVRQVTHMFNAMVPFHHRTPGLIGAALADASILLEVIPDGHHLAPETVAMLHALVGHRRLVAITDATGATGTKPGTHVNCVGGMTMVADGAVRLVETGALAGSNILMADALRLLQTAAGIPFGEALAICTRNPALSLNLQDEIGSAKPGHRADFTVLAADGGAVSVIRDGAKIPA